MFLSCPCNKSLPGQVRIVSMQSHFRIPTVRTIDCIVFPHLVLCDVDGSRSELFDFVFAQSELAHAPVSPDVRLTRSLGVGHGFHKDLSIRLPPLFAPAVISRHADQRWPFLGSASSSARRQAGGGLDQHVPIPFSLLLGPLSLVLGKEEAFQSNGDRWSGRFSWNPKTGPSEWKTSSQRE